MSAHEEARAAKAARGKGGNSHKPLFERASGVGGSADWTAANGTLMARAVASIGKEGGALRFGYTRDGGAYSIGVYDGDEKRTIYVSPNEDIDQVLQELIEYYET